MSALFGTRTQNAVPASSLNVQTSVQGIPIPIAYGKARAPGNLINYTDFAASKTGSGGKGGLAGSSGGKGSSSSYSYSAAVQIGLCEGPIQAVASVFNNQTQQSLSSLNLVALSGSYTQTTWGYEESLHPAQALTYRGLARVVAGPLSLGSSPALPNLSFVVHAAIADAVAGLPDADPSAMITDILTNPYYGVGVPAARIGDLSVYTAYCRATGMLMSQMITDLTTAQELVGTWLEATNSVAVWSQGRIEVVPYGDQAITAGTVVQQVEPHVIPNPATVTGNASAAPTIVLQFPGAFVADLGVTVASTGNAFTKVSGSPGTRQYQMPTSGTYVFSAADENLAISIAYSYSEPSSYTPPTVPLYAFGDDDFISGGAASSETPVQISRSAPQDQKNSIIVNFIDRSNAFALTPTPAAKDDAAIQMYGLRQDDVRDYHFFAYAEAATMSAHLLLGRQLVRNTYSWTADASFILLDPADLVSLTDAASGLNQQMVRITEIQENSDLTLTFSAEDYLAGSAHAPLYGSEPAAGYQPNYAQDPGLINAPVIFEPPSTLTGGTNELWVGVSGASAVWGGCDVYVSYDDTTFTLVSDAHLVGPSRTGVLTAALPAATVVPDANTLSVDISESIGAQLASTTQADAAALATLSYVDGELLAYQTATLTGSGQYSLTGLVRGGYGSPSGAHASGAAFLRLDDQVIKIPYNKALVGQQIFLKFVSFNIWGQGAQSLANVQAYEYVFSGGQAPGVLTGLTASLTQSGLTATLVAAWATDALSATYQAQVSSDAGATWTTVYDGAQPGFRQDGFKAQALQMRVRGVTSTDIVGVWASLSVAAPGTFTAAAAGYGRFIDYEDVNSTFVDLATFGSDLQADLNELASFTAAVVNAGSATAAVRAGNAGVAAALQTISGQTPAIAVSVATQTAGLLSQIAAQNSTILANAAKEIADVANLNSQISSLSASFNNSTAVTSGISAAQANINSVSALQIENTAVGTYQGEDSGELADFVSAVQTGNSQTILLQAQNANQAGIVQQVYANTTSLEAAAIQQMTLAATFNGFVATTNSALTVVSNATSANATSIATLTAQLNDPTQGLSATYNVAAATKAVVNDATIGNAALGYALSNLTSSTNTTSATVATLSTTVANQGQSISSLQTTVTSNYNSTTSSISSLSGTVSTQGSTLANLQTTVTSNYNSLSSNIATNSTSIATLSNEYGSLSTQVSSVSAAANGISANGQISLQAQSAPSGATARFATVLSVSGQSSASGGFYLDLVGGVVTATFDVGSFRIQNASTRTVPFSIDSSNNVTLQGVTYISSAIKSTATAGSNPVMLIDFVNGTIVISDAS